MKIFYLLIFSFVSICFIPALVIVILDRKATKEQEEIKIIKEKKIIKSRYVKPHFKELSQEQIDDIHARGKITPAKKVREWEGMDLCAPGDAIGSAAWRCRKFHHNCHDCLVDYANKHDEYISFFEIMKLCSPYKL